MFLGDIKYHPIGEQKTNEGGKRMIKQAQLKFKLGLTADEITPRAGLAVYTEFLRGLGVKDLIDKYMPLPGSNRGYRAWNYIEPLMLMQYGGGRHIEDIREIAEDKALRKLIGVKGLPSASAAGDWCRRMGNGRGLERVGRVIDETNSKALRDHGALEYTLWSDPTLIESGKAEAKMSYMGFKGYRPIITAFKELPVIAYHEFREGNAMGGTKEAVEAAYRILPEGKKIRHASLDSEFYTADVINFLMKKGTTFAIAADKDAAVMEAIRSLAYWRQLKTEDGIMTDREIAETLHTMNGTEKAFRLVVLRWRKEATLFEPESYCYHVIATSLECVAEKVVWEYNGRGQMENVIKELKGGIGMESLPSGDFGANAFWFALGVLTYNTFVLQKELLLPEEYKRKTIETLRWSVVGIAGKVVRHGRRLWLLLATTYEKLGIYHQMRKRCMAFG